MRRLLFAAPLAILLAAAACGDGEDKDEAEPTQAAEESPAGNVNEQPQVPDKVIPTPTPVPDGVPIVQVVVAGKPFAPTRSEFGELPKVKIDAGGKTYEGVSLSALAEKAGASSSAVATIQGTRADNLRLGAIRFPLGEIGGSTVFMLDEGGHLVLASSSVPEEQWLKDVTGIALN
jgi:hypothetical protein